MSRRFATASCRYPEISVFRDFAIARPNVPTVRDAAYRGFAILGFRASIFLDLCTMMPLYFRIPRFRDSRDVGF